MDLNRNIPIGVELVRNGIVKEEDVNRAIEYQKSHRNMKLGEILRITSDCNPDVLIKGIGEILGEKGMILTFNDIDLNIEDYISLDIAKECKVIPFSTDQGKIKACFADTANKNNVDKIRLLMLNKGLILEKYITFESNINNIIDMLEGKVDTDININADTIKLIDTIIKTAMSRWKII